MLSTLRTHTFPIPRLRTHTILIPRQPLQVVWTSLNDSQPFDLLEAYRSYHYYKEVNSTKVAALTAAFAVLYISVLAGIVFALGRCIKRRRAKQGIAVQKQSAFPNVGQFLRDVKEAWKRSLSSRQAIALPTSPVAGTSGLFPDKEAMGVESSEHMVQYGEDVVREEHKIV
ncbi:hypothetical protein BT69DRAFT_834169 [Atractiella rhizophila]|nr:hypothetical protein BT69DRAFT_834169 [Atractiella rhizophila]